VGCGKLRHLLDARGLEVEEVTFADLWISG